MLLEKLQENEHIPTTPLLAIHNNDVHLYALYEAKRENDYLGHLYMGSTASATKSIGYTARVGQYGVPGLVVRKVAKAQ